jgi:hypothetical protein
MPLFQNLAGRLKKLKRGGVKKAEDEAVVGNEHQVDGPSGMRIEDVESNDIRHDSLGLRDVEGSGLSAANPPWGTDVPEKAPEKGTKPLAGQDRKLTIIQKTTACSVLRLDSQLPNKRST